MALKVFSKLLFCLVAFTAIVFSTNTYAETLGEMRARYLSAAGQQGSTDTLRNKISVVAPRSWEVLSKFVQNSLDDAHLSLEEFLGELPKPAVVVQLLPEPEFFARTGAPSWTNALFYHGIIYIPIKNPARVDMDDLRRTVRHEYTHAVIGEVTNHKAPGWFDEGIAQLMEGPTNPLLIDALQQWLKTRKSPLPLSKLSKGFTKMPSEEVPAAYAQSLILVRALYGSYGSARLRLYLEKLHDDVYPDEASLLTFKMAPREMENLIVQAMNVERGGY
jgi:hypothetical protein